MTIDILKNIVRFFVLLFLQVFIVKNMELGRYFTPFIYVMFVVMLPFETPNWLALILSFIMGITIDMFYDTLGMHAAALTVVGFIRPSVLKIFSPREGYEFGVQPTIQYLGAPWFVSYTSILVLVHHFILFYIEVFRFSEFFFTFFKVLMSSLLTVILIVLSQYLFYKGKQND